MNENSQPNTVEENAKETEETSKPEAATETPVLVSPSKKSKKSLTPLLILIILLLASGLGYMILKTKKNSNTPTVSQASPSVAAVTPIAPNVPNTVAYAISKDPQTIPPSIYWRLSGNGDKTEAMKLAVKSYIDQSAVKDNQIALSVTANNGSKSGPQIWYSNDGGKTYNKIFEGKLASNDTTGDGLTSMIFSADGKSLVFGYLGDFTNNTLTNTVKELSLDAKHTVTNLFTTKSAGVFLHYYNSSTHQALYFEGCYYCDGNNPTKLLSTNTSSQVTKTMLDGGGASYQVVSSPDGKELLVMHGTLDASLDAQQALDGTYQGPPYSLTTLDPGTGTQTPVATIGQKGVRKPDGTVDAAYATIGYMADGKTPYYVSGKQVFKVAANKPSLLFEATQPIIGAFYVSDSLVYASSGDYSSYVLNRFDLNAKSNTVILNGDDKTTIFGVTTK